MSGHGAKEFSSKSFPRIHSTNRLLHVAYKGRSGAVREQS
jgi:hypothetical protein